MIDKEKELADDYKSLVDEILEIYYLGKYGLGEGTTLWKVRGVFAKEENKIRTHKAYLVLSNLMDTGYLQYSSYDPSLVVLTQKGLDYISGNAALSLSVSLNRFIDIDNVSVEEAFNRLWDLIGITHSSLFYLTPEKIYQVLHKYNEHLPPSYEVYTKSLSNAEASTESIFKNLLLDIAPANGLSVLDDLSQFIEKEYSIAKLNNSFIEFKVQELI